MSGRLVRLFGREVSYTGRMNVCGRTGGVPILGRNERGRVLSTIRRGKNRCNTSTELLCSGVVRLSETLRRGVINDNGRLGDIVGGTDASVPSDGVGITCRKVGNTGNRRTALELFPGNRTIGCGDFTSMFSTISGNRITFNILPIRGSDTNSISTICSLVLGRHFCVMGTLSLPVSCYLTNLGRSTFRSVRVI